MKKYENYDYYDIHNEDGSLKEGFEDFYDELDEYVEWEPNDEEITIRNAFQEYYDNVPDQDNYDYLFDAIQVLHGHFEYIDCVDIHSPYHQERPEGTVVLDFDLFMELARKMYNELIERGELRAEYY